MTPRNLRKPTDRRVHYWWCDFLRAWGSIGGMSYQRTWEDDEEQEP